MSEIRDARWVAHAVHTTGLRVELADAPFVEYGNPRSTVPKTLLADVLGVLVQNSVWTPDKLEGLGVTAHGTVYIATDNDGLDDAVGQTVFVEIDLG